MRIPYPVILASGSPRRKQILSDLGIEFAIHPADIDEDAFTIDDPEQTARRLAREKALAVYADHQDSLVIGADTVVSLERDGLPVQLAKPTDPEDAKRMLRLLSGHTHTVTTGVCLKWPKGLILLAEQSDVSFRTLTDKEIDDYVATGEPMDKAGAYGLQGRAQGFVAGIRGNRDNVIGLPSEALRDALREVR